MHPLVIKIAIEHDPVEIVDLPIDSMVDLSLVFLGLFTSGYSQQMAPVEIVDLL